MRRTFGTDPYASRVTTDDTLAQGLRDLRDGKLIPDSPDPAYALLDQAIDYITDGEGLAKFDEGVMAATKAIMNRIDNMIALELHAQKQGGIAERQLAPIRMNLLLQLADELRATINEGS